jgi:hypothetical protein
MSDKKSNKKVFSEDAVRKIAEEVVIEAAEKEVKDLKAWRVAQLAAIQNSAQSAARRVLD